MTRDHTCHARECTTPCAPEMLMCRRHWKLVPLTLANAVWKHFQPGQERGNATPSARWHKAARAAIDAIAQLEGHVVGSADPHEPTSATNASAVKTLYALTLHRPWPWAIAYLNKRVENRGWKPPAHAIGQWIAIHAGRVFDARAANAIYEEISIAIPTDADDHETGILAIAKLTGYAETEDSLETAQQRWWSGPVGWVFGEVVVFDTRVQVAGQQGLWKVEGNALAKCRAEYRTATRGNAESRLGKTP